MFRIELFCEDKNLANALRALTGLAIGQPVVMPVINATTKGNTVVPGSRAGSLTELFFEHLRKQSAGTVIVRKDVDAFTAQHGRPTSSQHMLRQALRHGLLKQEGTGKGNKGVSYRIFNTGGKK